MLGGDVTRLGKRESGHSERNSTEFYLILLDFYLRTALHLLLVIPKNWSN